MFLEQSFDIFFMRYTRKEYQLVLELCGQEKRNALLYGGWVKEFILKYSKKEVFIFLFETMIVL